MYRLYIWCDGYSVLLVPARSPVIIPSFSLTSRLNHHPHRLRQPRAVVASAVVHSVPQRVWSDWWSVPHQGSASQSWPLAFTEQCQAIPDAREGTHYTVKGSLIASASTGVLCPRLTSLPRTLNISHKTSRNLSNVHWGEPLTRRYL
jgi:hypothetical protein